MRLLITALSALGCAGAAFAHGGGTHTGFVATVSEIQPPQLGLLVEVTGGHERLSVQNLTQETIVLFGVEGAPALTLAPGETGSVADPRIGSTGPPPAQGEFVRDWRIPGEAGGERFEVVGFLGYRQPAGAQAEDGGGLPAWAVAMAVGVGVVVVAAALALPLRRWEGEGQR